MPLPITKRQKEVLSFIEKHITKESYSPTHEEIKRKLKLSAVSTVHQHIDVLIKKGYLNRVDNSARGIEIKKQSNDYVQIPLLGLITAGQPIEAIEEKQETIAVPKLNLPKSGDFFALKVLGDSMIDEHINDGDIVIIKKQSTAEQGDSVVALINNEEVTLKKIYIEKDKIRLQPANKNIRPFYIDKDKLQIQGKVIDVIKSTTTPEIKKINQKKTQKKEEQYQQPPINKIINNDAIIELKKFPDKSVDLVIADPPYNLSKGTKISWSSNGDLPGFGGNWNKVMESWDNMSFSAYFQFSLIWINEIKRVLKPTGSVWIFGTYHNIGVINTILQMLNMEMINEVVWYKRNAFPNLAGRRLTASHETLLWAHNGKKRDYYFDYKASKDFFDQSDNLKQKGKQMRTVWDIPNNKKAEELKYGKHPTQKPLRVCNRIISISSKPGQLILAPFAGAGSECVAAKEAGRNYVGMETDKKYVDIANKRLRNSKTTQSLF